MFMASVYGRLGQDPRNIDTSSGKSMAVTSVAVDVQERGNENPDPEWLGLVAFGGQADKLLQHEKGECVAVSGRVQRNRWTDRDGNEREQLQVVVDSLVSARTVRPGNKRRQESARDGRSAVDAMAGVAAGGEGQQNTTAEAYRNASGGRAPTQRQPAGGGDFYDDEIPF